MAKLMNGPYLVTESCTLDLSTLGLAVGDHVNVICIGGGGGCGYPGSTTYLTTSYAQGYGGGMNGIGSSYYGAAPGGSGYVTKATVKLTSTSVSVTIGEAGTWASSSGGTGTTGGTTSFGNYLSAPGGNGGKGDSTSSDNDAIAANGGSGGNDGSTAYYGDGGNGFVNDGTFSVKTVDGSGIQVGGKGAVFIWW